MGDEAISRGRVVSKAAEDEGQWEGRRRKKTKGHRPGRDNN